MGSTIGGLFSLFLKVETCVGTNISQLQITLTNSGMHLK